MNRKRLRALIVFVGLTLFVSAAIIASWFSMEGVGVRNAAAMVSLRLNARREEALKREVNKDMRTLNMAQAHCSRIKGHTCSVSELVPTFIPRIPTPSQGSYFFAHNAWNWERIAEESPHR